MTRKSLRTKRIFSIILSLAVALTMMPMSALAADESSPVGNTVAEGAEGGAAQIGEKTYSTLPEAVDAAQDGDTIKLLADYKTVKSAGEEEDDVGLTITKSVTLDLNGYKMDYFRVAQVDEKTNEVLTSGNLTVEDTSTAKTGKVTSKIALVAGNLTINGGTIGNGRDGVRIENGNLIVNGGTIDFLYGSNSGTVTITGGTVKNARFGEGFEITVTGGSGHTGLWDVSEGTWNISGGEFGDVTFLTASLAKNLHITGGTFGKITRQILKIGGNGEKVPAPISGLLADGYAFYEQAAGSKEYDQYVKLTDAITSLENVQVKGHTHSFVNGVCAVCDYACLHTNMNGDGFCPDCNTQMVAKIEAGGKTTYSTDFAAAMDNAANGTKITLLANAAVGTVLLKGKTVTLDLNGKTVKNLSRGAKPIQIGPSNSSAKLIITGRGSFISVDQPLVVANGTLDLSQWTGDDSYIRHVTISGANSRLISPTGAGKIERLAFIDSDTEQAADTASLNGGRYGKIVYKRDNTIKLGDLLAEGYAFRQNGTFLEYARELKNNDTVEEVEVVRCPHADAKDGKCLYCNQDGILARVGDTTYGSVSDAVAAWMNVGGTLTLYADGGSYGEVDFSSAQAKSFVIDLNGHKFNSNGTAIKTGGKSLTITDSKEKTGSQGAFGPIDADRGTLTLESGCLEKLTVPSSSSATILLKGGKVTDILYPVPIFDLLEDGYALMSGDNPVDPAKSLFGSGVYTIKNSQTQFIDAQKNGEAAIGSNTIPFALLLKMADSEIRQMGFTWYIVEEDGTTQKLAATTSDVTPGTDGVYTCNAANMTVDPNGWTDLEANKTYNVLCVVNGKTSDGTSKWQTPMRGYKLTVTKATPTSAPKYTAITKEGQTLADAHLTAVGENKESLFKALGTAIRGTVKWVESEDKTIELNPGTKVEQGKVYTWLFTPNETANYSTLTGTIVLWEKPASSGGTGGGAVAPAPTTPDTDVVTEKDSQTGVSEGSDTTTKTTVKESRTETAKNEQGQTVSKTTASVSKETAAELARQATEHKSDTVEITVKSGTTAAEANGVKSTELAIPKTAVEEIAKNTDADLVIKTDSGEVTLDNKTLETIAKEAKGDTVRIVVNENTKLTEAQKPAEKIIGEKGKLFDLSASIGEKLIHHFGGGKAHVTLPMPEGLKGKDVLVIYINDKGFCEILNHTVEKVGADSCIKFTTSHFSTFAVVDKEEAEALIKAQNEAHVKELMQNGKFKVTTTKTSKKSVKVTVTAKNNKTLISDIKTMGYTVKYQFYRSTKKTSGYKLLKTKTTSSFTNTKGKKGTKYYYKARVLVYDGKTLIAKSELKQASCGVRTWTK